jgi:hypothetical protein
MAAACQCHPFLYAVMLGIGCDERLHPKERPTLRPHGA